MIARRWIIVLWVIGGGCAGDSEAVDSCETQRCVTAPPPLCQGTIKTVFQAVGVCSEDPTGIPLCNYPIAQQQDCALLDDKLCTNGQCVTKPGDVPVPCGGVVCNQRPPADCDGNIARIYSASGTCNPARPPNGQCEHGVEAALDCSLTGLTCRDGGCIDPAAVPCDPNPCDVPPQGTCTGNTPTTVAAPGTCSEKTIDNKLVAECSYATNPAPPCTGNTIECWVGRCASGLTAPDAAGDLVINEVMKNPTSQGDEAEWFELFNPTEVAARIDGCTVSDDGGESFTIGADVIVPARGFLVLGTSLDRQPNGGFSPDYLYADFTLGNTADEVALTCGGVLIDRVLWTDLWPSGTGRSMSLGAGDTADAAGNDFLGAWCDAPARYGDGTNLGSPRRPNPPCPAP